MKYKINFIYGIGIRCYTRLILKRLNLHPFSSIFGSLYIKNFNNLIKCFESNFDILFNEKNLIYTKKYKKWVKENKEYGNRTINKYFDDTNDYHSATFAHHDLSLKKDLEHFKRGIKRLEFIKEKGYPILFINICCNVFNKLESKVEYNNTHFNKDLITSIKKCGFENFFIICIHKNIHIKEDKDPIKIDNYIIYEIASNGYTDQKDDIKILKIIKKYFDIDLLSIDFLENKIFDSN